MIFDDAFEHEVRLPMDADPRHVLTVSFHVLYGGRRSIRSIARSLDRVDRFDRFDIFSVARKIFEK